MKKFNNIVIFGGSGFIGSHLTQYLFQNNLVQQVYICDIKPLEATGIFYNLDTQLKAGWIKYFCIDVREEIDTSLFTEPVDLIINLAAVHREPGHYQHEYYETNVTGAKHINDFAKYINCHNMIFSSSIAVYGATGKQEEMKDEDSLPTPTSPYGKSKYEAEIIHQDWQKSDPSNRLLIIRPGVIFGVGENGNVTRMVKAVIKGYFVYVGNQETYKAGGYVKELCVAMWQLLEYQSTNNLKYFLANFSMNPAPTVKEFTESIKEVADSRSTIFSLPFNIVLAIAWLIKTILNLFGVKSGINPARVYKLRRSNNIIPQRLDDVGYTFKYSLLSALKDWKKDSPEDWN